MNGLVYLLLIIAGAHAGVWLPRAALLVVGAAWCAHLAAMSVLLWRRCRLRVLAFAPVVALYFWAFFAVFVRRAPDEGPGLIVVTQSVIVLSAFLAAAMTQWAWNPTRSRWFWQHVRGAARGASLSDLFCLRYLPAFDEVAATQVMPRVGDGAYRAGAQWGLVWWLAFAFCTKLLPQPAGWILIWSVFTGLSVARTWVIWSRTRLPLMTLSSTLMALDGAMLVSLAFCGRVLPDLPAWAWVWFVAGVVGMLGSTELEYRRHPGLEDAWTRHQDGLDWRDTLTLRNIPNLRNWSPPTST